MTDALEKLIADNEWRPIAEAPKDGNGILLKWSYTYVGDKDETCGMIIGWWNELAWVYWAG